MNTDLPVGVTIETAVTPDDFAEARALFEAYAQALYRSLGFREIEPYYANPLGQVTFMALDLATVTDAPAGSTERAR